MWIFLNNAFVSIVQDRKDPDYVWVRARIPGDLEAFVRPLFPTPASIDANKHLITPITETNDADYRFRTKIHRMTASGLVGRHAQRIDYTNFKSSIDESTVVGFDRHRAYLSVWGVMHSWQRKVAGFTAKKLEQYLGRSKEPVG